MQKLIKPGKICTLFIAGAMAGLLLASCHSEYLHIDYKLHHNPCYLADSSRVACIISTRAYLPPKGISRFPDGGQPEYLHENTALFVVTPGKDSISRIVEFHDLTTLTGSYRTSWKTRLACSDSLIFYYVNPVSDWDFILSHAAKDQKDTAKILSLKKKYNNYYACNLSGTKILTVDSVSFMDRYNKRKTAGFSYVNNALKHIPLADLCLRIQDIHPKTEKQYIKETIYLKNNSATTRRAVVEQIISNMDRNEIKELLKKMEQHEKSLSGNEKTSYKRNSKKLYTQIRDLL